MFKNKKSSMVNISFWVILQFLVFLREGSYIEPKYLLNLIGWNMSSFSGVKSGGWDLPQPEVPYQFKNIIGNISEFKLF